MVAVGWWWAGGMWDVGYERLRGRIERMEGCIERLGGVIERMDGWIERAAAWIERLRGFYERRAAVCGCSFRVAGRDVGYERVRGWIERMRGRIERGRSLIERMNGWIERAAAWIERVRGFYERRAADDCCTLSDKKRLPRGQSFLSLDQVAHVVLPRGCFPLFPFRQVERDRVEDGLVFECAVEVVVVQCDGSRFDAGRDDGAIE